MSSQASVQFRFQRPSGYPAKAPNPKTVGIFLGIIVIPLLLIRTLRRR